MLNFGSPTLTVTQLRVLERLKREFRERMEKEKTRKLMRQREKERYYNKGKTYRNLLRQKKENGRKKFIVQRSPKKERSTNDKKGNF